MVNRMTMDLRRAGAREPDAAHWWMSFPGIPLRKMRHHQQHGSGAVASSTSASSAMGPTAFGLGYQGA